MFYLVESELTKNEQFGKLNIDILYNLDLFWKFIITEFSFKDNFHNMFLGNEKININKNTCIHCI